MAKLIAEYKDLSNTQTVIEEGTNGTNDKKYYITGSFLKINSRNQNGNLYPRDVIEECISEFNEKKVKLNRAVGELNHPHTPEVDLNNIAIIIKSLEIIGDDVIGKALVTSKGPGENVKGLIDDGLSFGVSLRALGTLDDEQVMQPGMTLIAIDLVSDPSFSTSFVDPILESKEYTVDAQGNITVARPIEESTDKYTILEVSKAMSGMKENNLWYDDPEIFKPINFGHKKGWLNRRSHTQVQWTNEGVEILTSEKELETVLEQPVKSDEANIKTGYTINEVADAMKAKTDTSVWYDKPEINDPINFAAKKGWLYRPSTTQVEWTDYGIETLKGSNNDIPGVQEESYTISDKIKEQEINILEEVKSERRKIEALYKNETAKQIRSLFQSVYK